RRDARAAARSTGAGRVLGGRTMLRDLGADDVRPGFGGPAQWSHRLPRRRRRDREVRARGAWRRVHRRDLRHECLPHGLLPGSGRERPDAPLPVRAEDAGPLITVERTDFISVPVTDLERSRAFYGETLGLPEIPGPGSWPEFQLGENVSLYLLDPTNIGQEYRGPHSAPIALRVPDVPAAKQALEAKG